jgi:amino acid adenylation domain-containing protein
MGQLDLELVCVDTDQEVSAEFKYNTDVFDRITIERIADAFVILTEAMALEPDTNIGALPIMSDVERRRLIVEWNATTAPYPRDRCLHELFSDAARRDPTALAIEDGQERVTYGEAERRARSLARKLRERGVAANSIVAVCVPRSARAILSMLGILEAGGAYLPIETTLPPARIAAILADANVRVAVVGAEQAKLPCFGSIELLVADEALSAEKDDRGPLAPLSRATDLAYVIYTSGSTGVPKGVLLEHRSVVNTATWMQQTFDIGPGVRVSQLIALGFDGSVAEIWPALTAGASLHVVDEEIRRSPPHLVDWLRRSRIQVAALPTPLAERCVEESIEAPLPELRVMVTGGDKLHRPKKLPTFRLFNLYGPTESTVNTTFSLVDTAEGDEAVPIGRPIANARVHILDERMEPVPVGACGELFIGGECLARGYLNRIDLERAKFVPDVFSSEAGARLYRTGDLAKYRANGDIEFCGRTDQQVKIRGFRIELGEIEGVLGDHPAVRESVVTARIGAGQQTLLVAYVRRARTGVSGGMEGAQAEQAELRQYLAERLPEYMVPSAFVFVEAFPLTNNGKIDFQRLPEPVWRSQREFVPPSNATEEQLLAVWRALLANDTIGVSDDFFDAGGDSLLATRLLVTIEEVFDRRLTMAQVLQGTTVQTQARAILDRTTAEEAPRASGPSIVELAEGHKPALILVHAVGGGITPYRAIANELRRDRAVWAMAAPARVAPEITIERIAVTYADALAARQPTGPFLLGGWSMGGVLAAELAQELRRRGRTVALLLLIDTPFPRAESLEEPELIMRLLDFVFVGYPINK